MDPTIAIGHRMDIDEPERCDRGSHHWRLPGRADQELAYAVQHLYVMCSWIGRTPTPLSTYPALSAYKTWRDADPGIRQARQVEVGDVQCALWSNRNCSEPYLFANAQTGNSIMKTICVTFIRH